MDLTMAWTFGRGFIPGVHLGADLVAPAGTPIHAITGGVVTYAADTRQDPSPPSWSYWQGRRGAAGLAAAIDAGGGRTLLYVHLSRLAVRRGQTIRAGEVIGAVGATGYTFGAHLHLGLIVGGTFRDPLSLWTRAQLLAAVAGSSVTLVDDQGEQNAARALERLASIGISTDLAHRFTAEEAMRIATQLYGVSGSTAEAIAATLTGMTVGQFVDKARTGETTPTNLDPFTAVAGAIAGIPAALGGLLWLFAILALLILGLYVLVTPGQSEGS